MSQRPARPPASPLAMPPQPFRNATPMRQPWPWRLLLVLLLSALLCAGFTLKMHEVLDTAGMTALEWALLVLFTVNVGWICFAFVVATIGFIRVLARREVSAGAGQAATMAAQGDSRTAIVFPIYNEDVHRVFATVDATAQALSEATPGRFEFFILSDSTRPDKALQEEAAFLALQARLPEVALHYRRRTLNLARKAGNIQDFLSRWGGHYDYMVVYDADSFIDTDTLLTLVARMDANPHLGLLQTVPQLVGGRTLFARVQQFASAVYGPVMAAGMAWWSHRQGNYWGHNAIIRVRAFAEAAGLPVLPGRGPFGGHVLSHDFVEAALLCRAGWQVQVADDLRGSYEQAPPTLIDLCIRDRRWCQGNLQHIGVLAFMRRLPLASRTHLLTGIFSYLASPLWLALILVGLCLSLQNKFLRPEYFSDGVSLYPNWPVIDPGKALAVFLATLALLLVPKLYGLIATLASKRWRRSVGVAGIGAGVVIEVIVSALLAPILMLSQTASVLSVLVGRDAGWRPQQRDGGYPLSQIVRQHLPSMVFGLVLLGASLAIEPVFAAWLLPAMLGLLLAIPLSAMTASTPWFSGRHSTRIMSCPQDWLPPPSYSRARDTVAAYRDVEPADFRDLLWNDDLQRRRAHLADDHWPLQPGEVYPPLAIAIARMRWAQAGDDVVAALPAAERLALLNAPKELAHVSKALHRDD